MTKPPPTILDQRPRLQRSANPILEPRPTAGGYSTSIYGQPANVDAGVRARIPVHHVRNVTAVASMTAAIGRLPGPDETIHLWIGGLHSMGHVIAAVIELAAPATIETLHVATLTFSKDNAQEWATAIDAGKIGRLTVLCSKYFQNTSAPIYDYAAGILGPRKVKMIAVRSHCKLICAKLTDGRTVSAAGSANTRSAKTMENVDLTGHPDVYDFHVAQMKRCEGIAADSNQINC